MSYLPRHILGLAGRLPGQAVQVCEEWPASPAEEKEGQVTLDIPDVPPSPNKVLGKHWRTVAKEKEKWILWVRAKRPMIYLKPVVKMRLSIILAHSRAYDHDNAFAAVKPVIDALKRWQLIFDDSPEYLDLEVVQTKCPHKKRHTTIELEVA